MSSRRSYTIYLESHFERSEKSVLLNSNSVFTLYFTNAALDQSPLYSAMAEILYEFATDSEYAERRSPRQRQYTPLPWVEMSPKSVEMQSNPENIFNPELKVYPNPTQGIVFVEYDFNKTYGEEYNLLLKAIGYEHKGDCNKGEINVYSEGGKLLQTMHLNTVADLKTIIVTDYKPGIYIIEISDCFGNTNSVKITKTK